MENYGKQIEREANKSGAVDKAKGRTKETVGKIKQKVGSVLGDHELEGRGLSQQAEGKAQRIKGEVKEAIDDTVTTVKAGVEALRDKVKGARDDQNTRH